MTGSYQEVPPPAALAGQVACGWVSHDRAVHVLPDACVDIVFDTGRLVVVGPATQAADVPASPGHRRFGVRFQVGSAGVALRLPAVDLLDTAIPLVDLWGSTGRRLQGRVIAEEERHGGGLRALLDGLTDRRSAPDAGDGLVRAAALAMVGGVSLAEACRRVGLGERHLRRRFERAVGYGPATLVRVVRFQRFLDLAERHPDVSVLRLAVDAGYSDQAHLSRECRRLSGKAQWTVRGTSACGPWPRRPRRASARRNGLSAARCRSRRSSSR